jgi:hypothetical protein
VVESDLGGRRARPTAILDPHVVPCLCPLDNGAGDRGDVVAVTAGDLPKQRRLVPLPCRPPASALSRLGCLGLPEQPRHDGLPLALRIDVLLDLDREHLCLGHLPVQELHDAAQLRRYLVGNEDKPNPLGREVGADRFPVAVLFRDAERVIERDVRLDPPALALRLEPGPQ